MSVATKLQSAEKRGIYQRAILGPTGNRVRVLEESRMKGQVLKKPPVPQTVIKNNFSVDSSCSCSSDSDSNSFSSSSSSLKVATLRRTVKPNVFRTVKVLPHISQDQDVPVKPCDWITPNSDLLVLGVLPLLCFDSLFLDVASLNGNKYTDCESFLLNLLLSEVKLMCKQLYKLTIFVFQLVLSKFLCLDVFCIFSNLETENVFSFWAVDKHYYVLPY
ncbi:hypothetical protein M5689_022233 [Euphorbia peplus]|nr:hypothetical protein M5689_022233 [Euphorbia peplus]